MEFSIITSWINLEVIKKLFGMFVKNEKLLTTNCNSALKQKQNSPIWIFETGENAYPFIFISSFVSFKVSIFV